MVTKRTLLAGVALGSAAFAALKWWPVTAQADETFEVTHSDAEWQKLLTPAQYAVLRQSDTERPFTSPLLHETQRGIFGCAGCEQDLYSSDTKFDSGTGWPSFWAPWTTLWARARTEASV